MADEHVNLMANKLAEECLAVQKETGEDRLFMEVAGVLGASSQTLEEAFLTAIRTRMAEQQGRAFLAKKLKAHRAASE
ncbi:hypothetical protein ABMC89_03945 [Sulfitobacter sp. HNIBRBA3233]|uniref:hypothetical protein n=1 Tax=Sulfitobacter marinivivus TaxID=3158558 RepID=UPI0032DFC0AC